MTDSPSADLNNMTVAFIGAGNMASAIIGGLIAGGFNPKSIIASDPNPEQLSALVAKYDINTSTDNVAAVQQASVVVLAVKPQVLGQVVSPLAEHLSHGPVVVSIAAGISLESLSQWLGPDTALVRCMPNTPSLVGLGACGLFANDRACESQKLAAEDIMRSVGIVEWLACEADIDAVTAVSGSGPAYFFYVFEAMIAEGVRQGLSPDVAKRLTLETALGAATLARDSEESPEVLRRRVTSPNGTTEQAVLSFDRDKLADVFARAMAACAERSRELASELGA